MSMEVLVKVVGGLVLIGAIWAIVMIERPKRRRWQALEQFLLDSGKSSQLQDIVNETLAREAHGARYVAGLLNILVERGLPGLVGPENGHWIQENDYTKTKAYLEQAYFVRMGRFLETYDQIARFGDRLHLSLKNRSWEDYAGKAELPSHAPSQTV